MLSGPAAENTDPTTEADVPIGLERTRVLVAGRAAGVGSGVGGDGAGIGELVVRTGAGEPGAGKPSGELELIASRARGDDTLTTPGGDVPNPCTGGDGLSRRANGELARDNSGLVGRGNGIRGGDELEPAGGGDGSTTGGESAAATDWPDPVPNPTLTPAPMLAPSPTLGPVPAPGPPNARAVPNPKSDKNCASSNGLIANSPSASTPSPTLDKLGLRISDTDEDERGLGGVRPFHACVGLNGRDGVGLAKDRAGLSFEYEWEVG